MLNSVRLFSLCILIVSSCKKDSEKLEPEVPTQSLIIGCQAAEEGLKPKSPCIDGKMAIEGITLPIETDEAYVLVSNACDEGLEFGYTVEEQDHWIIYWGRSQTNTPPGSEKIYGPSFMAKIPKSGLDISIKCEIITY